jgi:triosephosphate isomerase
MRPLIAGNWKMNGLTGPATALAEAIRDGAAAVSSFCDLLVCPPYTQLGTVGRILAGSPVALGGQNCHHDQSGPHTGDISAAMLRDVGASAVILGHSERRATHCETDEQVREKVIAAMAAGLTPIVCVGETEEQRQSGRESEVVGWQLAGSLPHGFTGVVSYEPVWAIGTGRACEPPQIEAMHGFIRQELTRQFGKEGGVAIRLLYGGSVKPDNAAALFRVPEVNGALVGGAALNAEDFLAIARAAG